MFATLVLCAVLLTGCFNDSVEELYKLPKSSDLYIQIQSVIDGILADGNEYSAPLSGYNRQAVQLHDLDGDGIAEAIAFVRDTADMSLHVYLLKYSGTRYEISSKLDGEGSGVDSAAYYDLNGDGVREIVVSWQLSPGVKTLEIWSVSGTEPAMLFSDNYIKYAVEDMNLDGIEDMVLIRPAGTETPTTAVIYESMPDGELIALEAYLSESSETVTAIKTGFTSDGIPAAYIDSSSSGGLITDIIACRDGSAVNVSLSIDGTNSTYRNYSISCDDINGDGIVEIPAPLPLYAQSETQYYAIVWNAYTSHGFFKSRMKTFQNYSDGWYLILDGSVYDNISVRRDDTITGERTIVFSRLVNAEGENVALEDFLKIYTISGDNKEGRATLADRNILTRSNDKIYAYEVIGEAVSDESVKDGFKIIITDWNNG